MTSEHIPQRLGLRRKLAKAAAGIVVATAGTPVLGQVLRSLGPLVPGASTLSQAMLPSAEAALKKFTQRTVKEKLANVPVFMIVNKSGSPYLTQADKIGETHAVFYTSYEDAKNAMQEMLQVPGYRRNCRLFVLSLDKAFEWVNAEARGTGVYDSFGNEETMAFTLHEAVNVKEKLKSMEGLGFFPSDTDKAIPAFVVEGLTVKKDGSDVTPVFLDPKDLVDVWAGLPVKARLTKPKVQIYELPELILAMEDNPKELKNYGFFPPSTSLEFVAKSRAHVGTRAKPYSRLREY